MSSTTAKTGSVPTQEHVDSLQAEIAAIMEFFIAADFQKIEDMKGKPKEFFRRLGNMAMERIRDKDNEIERLKKSNDYLVKDHNAWFNEAERLSAKSARLQELFEIYKDISIALQKMVNGLQAEANRTMTELCEARGRIKELEVFIRNTCDVLAEEGARLEGIKEKYNELIMAVGNKHPGETRHETALRYILKGEKGDVVAAQEKADIDK